MVNFTLAFSRRRAVPDRAVPALSWPV